MKQESLTNRYSNRGPFWLIWWHEQSANGVLYNRITLCFMTLWIYVQKVSPLGDCWFLVSVLFTFPHPIIIHWRGFSLATVAMSLLSCLNLAMGSKLLTRESVWVPFHALCPQISTQRHLLKSKSCCTACNSHRLITWVTEKERERERESLSHRCPLSVALRCIKGLEVLTHR